MGQTAYFGPAKDSLAHFASLGHEPVGLVNPADYLLEVTLHCVPPLIVLFVVSVATVRSATKLY